MHPAGTDSRKNLRRSVAGLVHDTLTTPALLAHRLFVIERAFVKHAGAALRNPTTQLVRELNFASRSLKAQLAAIKRSSSLTPHRAAKEAMAQTKVMLSKVERQFTSEVSDAFRIPFARFMDDLQDFQQQRTTATRSLVAAKDRVLADVAVIAQEAYGHNRRWRRSYISMTYGSRLPPP